MNREQAELLMNRAIDGLASADEREQLARILRANPLLRSEFEDMQAVHVSTESLFRQLALPVDFGARVMRRVQGVEVPSDIGIENVRLPEQRAHNGRLFATTGPARRTVRIYALIAAVSAAAAVMLAVGVFSGAFARAGIGTQALPEDGKAVAEGRRGVPDRGELHRTDSPTPQPLGSNERKTPDGDTVRPEGSSVETPGGKDNEAAPAPLPPLPKSEPEQPAPPKETQHPDPRPEDVVKHEPEPAQPQPEDTVEQPKPKTPEGGKTSAVPDTREVAGKLLVMSGRAELINEDGSSTRLQDKDQQVFCGDRIRTKYGAVVLLQLPGGDVTLGKDTQVVLDSSSSLTLEGGDKGQIALDRGHSHGGSSLEVKCDEYSLFVMSGTAIIERKRRGLNVTKATGFTTITHETFGSLLLDETSGYESEVEFGKEFGQPKAKRVSLPDWSSEARSQAVMMALDPDIQTRQFTQAAERAYLQNKLPGKLEKLLENPACTDCVVTWLRTAIGNEKLEGAAIVKMVGEVEIAYFDFSELNPDVINGHADRAASVAESFDQWREYFYRLMRPPVEPKNPNQPGPAQPSQPVPP
ncbi:MAG: hypothetical protein H6841_03530 [Planctomycetes bacterium]|nr:hypothetical protein [Planctomycetota bacterium]MCB9934191.1 hypothetical protein [Planctomycetota bacterium]